MEAVETFEVQGLNVSIYHDPDCTSPREWDNLGVIRGNHRDYKIGDGEPEGNELRALKRGGLRLLERYLRLCEGAIAFTPVGMLDHSGITFYAGGGSHRQDPGGWDSGTVGYTYVTRQRCDELGAKYERAEEGMLAELKEYDTWARGECYGFVITDREGDEVAAVWGYIGLECAIEEAKMEAQYAAPGREFVDAAPVGETIESER